MPWLKRYLWTLIWLLSGPGIFLTFVPLWLVRLEGRSPAWVGHPLQWVGAWVLLNGLGLAVWCAYLFFQEGRGTPLPSHPPERFVAVGPYRYVRNPMAIGLFLVLAAEACLYLSWWVAAYAVAIISLVATFVLLVEEPGLERRFGPLYCAYKNQVSRWIPQRPSARIDL